MKKSLILLIIVIIMTGCAKKTVLSDVDVSEKTLYERAYEYYENENWGMAIEGFQSYIFSYPASSRTEKAQYYLADGYYNEEDYRQAIIEFNYFLNNFKNLSLREQGYFKLAMSYYKLTPSYQHDQTLTVNAINVIEDFKLEFPGSELISDIDSIHRILLSRLEEKKLHTANFYIKRDDPAAAEIYLADIIPENLLPQWQGWYLYKYGIALFDQAKYGDAASLLSMIGEDDDYYGEAQGLLKKINNK